MDKILGVYLYIVQRLAEPSSHASISALLAMGGLQLDHGIVHDVMIAISIMFGSLGFFVKEAKPLTVVK